jgi:hypothetical protein
MIIIDAKRWFDRKYGNTYHSVSVNVDGKHIGRADFAYGYGEQYLQSAHEILMDAGIFPRTGEHFKSGADKDYSGFMDDMRNNREKYHVTCADVSRKKDL